MLNIFSHRNSKKKHKKVYKCKPHVLLGVKVLQGCQNVHGPIEAHVVLPGGLMTKRTLLI